MTLLNNSMNDYNNLKIESVLEQERLLMKNEDLHSNIIGKHIRSYEMNLNELQSFKNIKEAKIYLSQLIS